MASVNENTIVHEQSKENHGNHVIEYKVNELNEEHVDSITMEFPIDSEKVDESSKGGAVVANDTVGDRASGKKIDEDDLNKSIYIGNVDYSTTPKELHLHFQSCGSIKRITILVNKLTGHPMGYAYVEFAEESGAEKSLLLNDSVFKDRQLQVKMKRKNLPAFQRGGSHGRRASRGSRGKFMSRGHVVNHPYMPPASGYGRGYFNTMMPPFMNRMPMMPYHTPHMPYHAGRPMNDNKGQGVNSNNANNGTAVYVPTYSRRPHRGAGRGRSFSRGKRNE